jgi:hypothetical protein
MTVMTQTVTINAAFLQEIKEDNEELWSLLERLQVVVLSEWPPRVSRRQLHDVLARLRDQLALHFALEEAYGYFEDAIEVAPRLSIKADRLRGQHADFYVEICDIADHAERLLHREVPARSFTHVVARFDDFCEALRRHEAAENQLIQQAFNEDLGGWD